MAKISLNNIVNTYNTTLINDNFDDIEAEFQNKVLYRNNPVGEPNHMLTNLDMNSKRILNLPAPLSQNEPVRVADIIGPGIGATANLVKFTPYANLSSTTVQAAIQEEIDDLSSPSGSSLISTISSGAGAVSRTQENKNRDTISIKDFGAVGDGVTDDTAALVLADTASRLQGKTLVIYGTPLIKLPLVFNGKSNWRFGGSSGILSSDLPTSYLIKHSSVNGPLLTFTAGGVVLEKISIVGQVGNTGDGIALWGNSPQLIRPFVTGMGQDGIRIGRDSGISNVNSFFIEHPRCISNGRYGININDKPAGAPDANSGSLVNPICNSNGSHGIYGGNAFLGVVIICPTTENNTGYGIYLDTLFRQNVIIGGDTEVNVAGNLFQAVPYANTIINLTVQGKTILNRGQISSYTPIVTGSTTAGTATYISQEGEFEVSGATVAFSAHVNYNTHTGTGQPYITLPIAPYGSSPNMQFSPIQVVTSGIVLSAGAQVIGLINRDGNRIQLYTNNAGALAPLNIPSSGEFYIRGTYPLNTPNYFAI